MADLVRGVPVSASLGEVAAESRGEYLQMLDRHKLFAIERGHEDFTALLDKVGADAIYAQHLVQELVDELYECKNIQPTPKEEVVEEAKN
jgi:hypothetical protein